MSSLASILLFFTSMLRREANLNTVLENVELGLITVRGAADASGLHPTTIRRKLKRLRASGPAALAHGLRGRPSNRRFKGDIPQQVRALFRTYQREGGASVLEFHAALTLESRPSYATLCRWLGGARQCAASVVGRHLYIEVRATEVALIDEATGRVLVRRGGDDLLAAARSAFCVMLERAGIPQSATVRCASQQVKRRLRHLLRALGVELRAGPGAPACASEGDLLDDAANYEYLSAMHGSAFVRARQEQWQPLVDRSLSTGGGQVVFP